MSLHLGEINLHLYKDPHQAHIEPLKEVLSVNSFAAARLMAGFAWGTAPITNS